MKRVLLLIALAAASCATPPAPPIDPAMDQLTASARAAYERHDHQRAASFYEKALQLARARDHRSEISSLACNLAACRLLLGQTDGVAALLAEARGERLHAGQRTDDLDLLEANLLRATKKPADANALARRVAESTPTPARAQEAWLLVGLLASDAHDAAGMDAALKKAGNQTGPLGYFLHGEASLLREDAAGAGRHFDRAAKAYGEADRPSEMADALARSGAAYEKAGNLAEAADRYYRAARSAHARGDEVSALKHIQRGLGILGEKDTPARAALLALFEDIQRAMPATPN